jgi:eukaryotic-like serine/threonine-protein kinase
VVRKRFRAEARAAAALHHPNVATIFSVEELDKKPFITMEYVEGKTLDAITPVGGMDIKTFLEVFPKVADALCSAHEKGVIHRDIKPGNIMISTDEVPKILDFGLAQITGDSHAGFPTESIITLPGQILGTPSYMSPEQAQGKDVDHRSDIFSFGIVMYEALAGRRPFTGENNAEVISNLLNAEPQSLAQLRPEIPSIAVHLIELCLRKLRRDRVQSMEEVCSILEAASAQAKSGISTGSLGRRLYRETVHPDVRWTIGAAIGTLILAFLGWYIFSRESDTPPFSIEKITMRRVTQSNNIATASISPDGTSMAYVTTDEQGNRTMWLRRIDDNNPIMLVAPESVQYWSRPVFSDDGGQVYYMTAGRAAMHASLFRVSALGGPPRKLVDTVNHLGSISLDGQRILYVRGGPATQILSANATDGGAEQVLLTSPDPETGYREPRYSSDGKSIYYIKRELIDKIESWSLSKIASSGGPETEIVKQRERIADLYVLQDSRGLLISAIDPATNLQQLFHYSLRDGKRTRLTNDTNSYGGISVDRVGKNVITIQRFDAFQVFVGQGDDLMNLKPLTKKPNAGPTVDWSPDGRIVFDAYENNRQHIWISDDSGKSIQQLTGPNSVDVEPRVSADGRFIVFTSTRAGFNQIWRMNIDGSNQVPLADVTGSTQSPRFAADGRTVVFFWFHDGARTLARVPVTGGPVEPIVDTSTEYSYYWAMSPNGRKIAYTYRDVEQKRSKLAVRNVESNEPFVIMDIWPTGYIKWTPDSKRIFYHERQAVQAVDSKVFQIDPTDPIPKVLYSGEPDIVGDLSYSQDGKKVAVIKGKTISDAVMLSIATPN